jgi:hypothetical protein
MNVSPATRAAALLKPRGAVGARADHRKQQFFVVYLFTLPWAGNSLPHSPPVS